MHGFSCNKANKIKINISLKIVKLKTVHVKVIIDFKIRGQKFNKLRMPNYMVYQESSMDVIKTIAVPPLKKIRIVNIPPKISSSQQGSSDISNAAMADTYLDSLFIFSFFRTDRTSISVKLPCYAENCLEH